MPRQSFGDFLNDNPRGRGRGRGRGGFGGGRGGRGGGRGGFGGGGRGGGGRGGRGGRGGWDTSRGRGGNHSVRGGHFGADYSAVQLDYSTLSGRRYHKFEPSIQPFAPDEDRRDDGPRQETPRRVKSFAPHGGAKLGGNTTSSGPSGTNTPITSGLGYHRNGPRTAAREIDGVITWGGGKAPLFVKAGELFRDGEVDVVKRDGDVFVVEHYPLSDPSAPQMHDLHDDVEIEIEDEASREQALDAVEAHRHSLSPAQTTVVVTQPEPIVDDEDDDQDIHDGDDVERILSEHIETLVVDDSHVVVTEETAIVVDEEEQVVYSPSAPVAVLEVESTQVIIAADEADVRGEQEQHEEATEALDDALFFVDTTGTRDDDIFVVDTTGTNDDEPLFFVDTTGDASGVPDTILYDAPAAPLASRSAPTKPSLEDEAIVYRPRLIEDPVASSSRARAPDDDFELRGVLMDPRVAMSRKDRKRAKKEKRSRNKRNKRKMGGGTGQLHIASDGSDLDWGSDGPPKVLSVDAHGEVVGDEELDPDLDDDELAAYVSGMARIRADNAAMAYMESDSDEWDDEDMEDTQLEIEMAKASDSEDDDEDDEEEEEDDDESSEDDFTALADAYSEDEFASDGEAKMFTGVTQWDDDDDEDDDDEAEEVGEDNAWFLESMENALDGGAMAASRRERNKVFRAVANGSFDDDFAIAPAQKKKKAPSHLPQELQDQWARDRSKKAEKKRERELARALAMLDPSMGFGRKANKKKGKKGQAAAARIAHLIPGSAAEVAELFDIPSDEDEDGGWGVKYKRRNPLLPPTLADIDTMIQDFMADNGRTTLTLPPMDRESRRKVHMLAECYDLKSKSKGKGVSRFPILLKLARSGLVNEKTRDRLVAAGDFSGGSFYKALYARKNKGEKEKNKFARGTGASVRAKEGDLVGEGADKIGEDNVGHKLLSKMGWSEGVTIGLGGAGGLEAPIVAVVKNTKRGLGSYAMGWGGPSSGYGSGAGAN